MRLLVNATSRPKVSGRKGFPANATNWPEVSLKKEFSANASTTVGRDNSEKQINYGSLVDATNN